MPWTEIDLLIRPLEPWRDLLMVELAELGFDSFEETPQSLKAAIRQAHRLTSLSPGSLPASP